MGCKQGVSCRPAFPTLQEEIEIVPPQAGRSSPIPKRENAHPLDWLTGSSEMSKAIRAKDWSTTPLGPIESWPPSLTGALSNCLSALFPMVIYWGPNLVFFYNDSFIPVTGDKHPQCLGRNARDVWYEIWDIVGPDHERVYKTGESFLVNDQLLPMKRFGYLEECYSNHSLSPIKISNGTVGGVLGVLIESTYRVLNERRQKLLRELAQQTASAKSARDVCAFAATIFAKNTADIPFALTYLIDRDSRQAHLAGSSGFQVNDPRIPDVIDLTEKENLLGKWPINMVVQTAIAQKIPDLFKHFCVTFSSHWPEEATREALLLPIRISNQTNQTTGMFGVLVAGINPRRVLDNDYRTFFDLVSEQIANAIVNARAYEEEELRAKRLEELDRAKTAFFSNISHEFRTPLTLILDPLEDALADQIQPLPDRQSKRIEMVKRNAFRLLKLVNSLLDFSRIEAGRAQVSYVPTNLAKYTADLVSVFRSAIEKAGLTLHLDMHPIDEQVYIDKNSWEKIIFNLLSNALKFTHEGSIKVTLKRLEECVEVRVIDTGIGIPKQELPHMFERFHRIENVHGRSQEGTGIGLALTKDLVKLHCGNIQVESEEGKGSVFTVSIPLGKAHLPSDRINEEIISEDKTGRLSVPFVEEAFSWLPTESKEDAQEKPTESTTLQTLTHPTVRETVLLADDNSDMREYVRQLLSDHWEVYAVADGEAALQAAREIAPDLILSDVMMPKMDGFQLTQELRNDPRTALIPIVLLSARAGEESSREGLQQGADDYIVKPFTANVLIDRVKAHMELGRLRIQLDKAVKERTHELQETIAELEKTASALRKSEESYRILTSISPAGIFHCDKEGEVFFMNGKASTMLGLTLEDAQGEKWTTSLHPEDKERVYTAWKNFIGRKTDHFKEEYRFLRPDGSIIWVVGEVVSEKDDKDQVKSYVGTLTDISEAKELEKKRLRASQQVEEHQRMLAKKAEEANEAKSAFLAHMSHEIRTPLTGVLGLLELIQEESMSEEGRDYLKTARTSGMSLMGILNNILDISKIESHQIELEKISVNPITIAQELIQLYSPEAKKQDTNLTLNITPEVPPLLIGDPVRLRQILSNLISNAVKFTKNGSISVTLTGQECPGNNIFNLRGAVIDTGIGIKPEMLSRLFQPFMQADKSIMRQFGGSGLGLHITKSLCEIMGGEIKATSQVGVGSTFQFTVKMELPKKQALVLKKYPEQSGDLKKFSDLHILIAEDNPVCWKVLKTILEWEGCSLTVVENGLKAVEETKRKSYDLILMNGEMPVMGGLEATRKIRQMFNRQTLPIIGVTAHDLDQQARFLASGMNGFLTKPVKRNTLKTEILRYLEESTSKSEKFSRLHILIAEDNPVNQLVLKTMLSREGCSITVVDNGLKAVEATMRESYDLILMDGEMPVMDGLEATRKIRQMFSHQALRVIGITAHALDTHKEKFLGSGMDGYLTKPIDRDALKAEILRCLGTGG